jgi:hypothetical protein
MRKQQSLVLSNQVFVTTNKGKKFLAHRITGNGIKSSPNLESLLELFRSSKYKEIGIECIEQPSLQSTINLLRDLSFLIPGDIDEELDWLKKKSYINNKNSFESEHFIGFYKKSMAHAAREFIFSCDGFFAQLSRQLKYLGRHKPILYFCKSLNEFDLLYGKESQEWLTFFVLNKRILIVNFHFIRRSDLHKNILKESILHELTHIFLGQMGSVIPIWLEEGVCEYFSKDSFFFNYKNRTNFLGKVWWFREIESATKCNLLDIDCCTPDINFAYIQSHLFVAFISHLIGKNKLILWITESGFKKDCYQVFYDITDKTLEHIEIEWRKWTGIIS